MAPGHNSYEMTRFNAVKHAILSRDTVLPWEDETEYGELLDALADEHKPQGPTEEHLVEELAGILWRKRRLRLAEASAMREGLYEATRSYSDTGMRMSQTVTANGPSDFTRSSACSPSSAVERSKCLRR